VAPNAEPRQGRMARALWTKRGRMRGGSGERPATRLAVAEAKLLAMRDLLVEVLDKLADVGGEVAPPTTPSYSQMR